MMNSSSPTIETLSEGVQHLRLVADKYPSPLMMTPPPSDDSAKSQKSTSNHSDHHQNHHHQDKNAYVESLKEEREQLSQFPEAFKHVFTLIEKELNRVDVGDPLPVAAAARSNEHQSGTRTSGAPTMLSEIVMVPVEKFPTYNFVGRILGPRGTTAQQLEKVTGCRITILGRKKKDGSESSAPVDNGPLRVQVSVSSDELNAVQRLDAGVALVEALLCPPADGQDDLKRQQLMVLASLNGTYRPRTTLPVPMLPFNSAGDHGHSFNHLLPFGYRLPGTGRDNGAGNKANDCFNPKCALLRGLIEQNNCNNAMPKVEDVLSVMHMYELMNRIRLANSSLFPRQEVQSKAQEIGNRMCSSIGVPRRRNSTSSAPPTTAPGASSSSGPTRRLYNVKSRPLIANSNNNQTP